MCLLTSVHPTAPDTSSCRKKLFVSRGKKSSGREGNCSGAGSEDLPALTLCWSNECGWWQGLFRPCTAEREGLGLLRQNIEKDQRESLEIRF